MKITKHSKKFSLVLVLMMLSAVLFGCGNEEEEATGYTLEPATFEVDETVPSWQVDDSTAELTWYVNYDWFTQVWGEDVATQYITEDTGVSITYMAGTDEKFNQMLASGDLPDIVTIDATSPLCKDADQWAIPLDELAAEYDPYFMSTAAKPEVINYYTEEDGHIYGYPNYATTPSDYEMGGLYGNAAFLVREDIYNDLGQPDMSTPEAFLDTLRAVQEGGYTDANGDPVVPFGTWGLIDAPSVKQFCDAWADMIGVPLTTEDGEYYDRYNDEDFILWMKTLNQAYQEGLCDPDMFTMDDNKNNSQIINGSYAFYFQPNIVGDTGSMEQRYAMDPEASYIAIDGPASTMGREGFVQGPSMQGWTITFITEDCENPQKAIELISYLVSPYGDTVMNYGREGETYTMVDGVPVLNEDLLEYKQTDYAGFEAEVGLGCHGWVTDSAKLSREMGIEQFSVGIQQQKAWTSDKLLYPGATMNITRYLTDEDNRNLEKIEQNWATTFSAILTSENPEEIDVLYEEYNTYRDENGWDAILEGYNKQIEYNLENAF